MVVHGISDNSKYFSGDFPDIQVRGLISNVELLISVAGSEHRELYTPDGNGVVYIRGIGNIVEQYFDLPPYYSYSDHFVLAPLSVALTFKTSSENKVYNLSVYYSRICLNKIPSDYIKFLSRYSKIYTTEKRREFVTFIKQSTSQIRVKLTYLMSGQMNEKTFFHFLPADNDCIVSTDVSVKKIASESSVSSSDIISYTVECMVGDYSYDSIEYIVDKKTYPNEIKFLYYNHFGVIESCAFTGFVKENPELIGSVSKFIYVSSRINAYIKHIYNAFSGYINSEKYKSVLDMIVSPHVYLYTESVDKKEIVVSEYNLERTIPVNEVYGVDITFYFASKRDNDYVRLSDGGVFDFTFDNTFN